jgi:hypothetical protein
VLYVAPKRLWLTKNLLNELKKSGVSGVAKAIPAPMPGLGGGVISGSARRLRRRIGGEHRRAAGARSGRLAGSANPYRHIEETRVHRFVVSWSRDFGRSFRFLSLNKVIEDADYRVAFVRPRRVREKNLFPNAGNATGLSEWHMPLVPATIVKRNAVMRNRLSSLRRFSWHLNSSPFDRP